TAAPPTTSRGLPLTVSDGSGVTAISLDVVFDPALLSPTGATVAPDAAAQGWTAAFNTVSPGRVHVALSGPAALPAGAHTFATLQAAVPDTAPYRSKEVLDLQNLLVNGQPGAVADNGIHAAAYLGDTDGNRQLSSNDASMALRVGVGLDGGLANFRLLDPAVVADASGDGQVSSVDASLIIRKVVGFSVPQIPDLPTGITPPPTGGPDPVLSLPRVTAAPGSTVRVPVELTVTAAGGVVLAAADLALRWDPRLLMLNAVHNDGTL